MSETAQVTNETAQESRKAMITAVANQKGGVGKTTTSVTLAAGLARMGKRVLLIDLDPHACASVHLRFYPEDQDASIDDIFADEAVPNATLWNRIRKQHPTLEFDMVPATIRLSELEIDLRNRKGKGAILQQALEAVRPEYDYIILDCPPHVGVLLVNALVACDLLVVVGTSGLVQPAASLPALAQARGVHVIEINPVDSGVSALAQERLRMPAGAGMQVLLDRFG